MIVGVESNFVLELTFRQEEARDCARILELAEQQAIQLVIPACALFEPYETLIRRSKERKNVDRALKRELDQLARTDTYARLGKASQTIRRVLAESGDEQAQSLADTIDRIVGTATVIPLDAEVIRRSREGKGDLPPQDAVVLASIVRFLEAQGKDPKLFANRNRRDFRTHPVKDQLAKYNCKLLFRFSHARGYIEAAVQKRSLP
jgi:predicted nucleic acid-binding protein